MIIYDIAPGEKSWWIIDCTDFLNKEGPGIVISSVRFSSQVGTGNIAINPVSNPYQINGDSVSFFADATLSPPNTTSVFELTFLLSSGESIPRGVTFNVKNL